jgi:uncharacterized protein
MRTNDVDILIIPGWTNSGPDHWQSRWETRLKTASRVMVPDFDRPVCAAWVAAIVSAVDAATRPVILVAHGCGVAAVAHAGGKLDAGATRGRVQGAILVAPTDVSDTAALEHAMAAHDAAARRLALPVGFDPLPTDPLPFPSLVVTSRTDGMCSYEAAGQMALGWGSELVDAGEMGHINTASGHGPWPEGALRFGSFLRQLSAASDRPTFM